MRKKTTVGEVYPRPRERQATPTSRLSNALLQTVPQTPSCSTSRRPSSSDGPPTSLALPAVPDTVLTQDTNKRQEKAQDTKLLSHRHSLCWQPIFDEHLSNSMKVNL